MPQLTPQPDTPIGGVGVCAAGDVDAEWVRLVDAERARFEAGDAALGDLNDLDDLGGVGVESGNLVGGLDREWVRLVDAERARFEFADERLVEGPRGRAPGVPGVGAGDVGAGDVGGGDVPGGDGSRFAGVRPGVGFVLGLDAAVPTQLEVHELADAVAGWERMIAWCAARQAEVAAELTGRDELCPDDGGGRFSSLHPVPVTAAALCVVWPWTKPQAERLVDQAVTLVQEYPRVHRALMEGRLDVAKARILTRALRKCGPEVAELIEKAVLPFVHAWTEVKLSRVVNELLHELDAVGAKRRRRRARDRRGVWMEPGEDGMAWLTAYLPAEEAAAVMAALNAAADAEQSASCEHSRTCTCAGAADRPTSPAGDHDHGGADHRDSEPVADGSSAAGSTGGDAGSAGPGYADPSGSGRGGADHRDSEPVADGSSAAGSTGGDAGSAGPGYADPSGSGRGEPGHGDSGPVADGSSAAGSTGRDGGRVPECAGRTRGQRRADALASLGWLSLTTGHLGGRECAGCGTAVGARLAKAHGRAVTVNVTVGLSTLLGLSEHPAFLDGYGPIDADAARVLAAAGVWRWVGTAPAGGYALDYGTTRYVPPQELVDFVLLRDRECVMPGCHQQAQRCEIDHRTPWPFGPTSACNCSALCKGCHVQKHRAGWTIEHLGGGRQKWTSPTGHSSVVTFPRIAPDVPAGAKDQNGGATTPARRAAPDETDDPPY